MSYKRSDFVPGLTRDDKLAFLDFVQGEIQSGRRFINGNRKPGDALRSVKPTQLTLNRLRFNAGKIEFLPYVRKELESAYFESSQCHLTWKPTSAS